MDNFIEKSSLPLSIVLSIIFVYLAANAKHQPVSAEPTVAKATEPQVVDVWAVQEAPTPSFEHQPDFTVAEIAPPVAEQVFPLPSFPVLDIEKTFVKEPEVVAKRTPPPVSRASSPVFVPPTNCCNSVENGGTPMIAPRQPLIPVFFYQPPMMVFPVYTTFTVYPVYPVYQVPQPVVTGIVPGTHGTPTFVFSNGVRMKPMFHVPGQPMRNRIRGFAP